MNPYNPPPDPGTDPRVCVVCGHQVERQFSSMQRIRCEGCGCLLALKLSSVWAMALTFTQVAASVGLVYLPIGNALRLVLLVALLVVFFAALSLATSLAGKLWPVHQGVFVSKQQLELARQRFFGQVPEIWS